MRYEDQRYDFRIDVAAAGSGGPATTNVAAAMVVTVIGEIDINTAPLLGEAIDDALARDSRYLVVDLADVGFCDSSGLNVLLRLLRKAGELRVVASDPVRRLIEVTGLTSVIRLFDSAEDALTATDEPGSGHR